MPCLGTEDCIEAAAQFLGGAYCLNKGLDRAGRLPTAAGVEVVEATSGGGDDDPRIACLVSQIQLWQTLYVDALQAKYPRPQYTGMNVQGACQAASGVKGASIGHPVATAGSRCDWMIACVHPKYGTPTATAVGEAMWDLWLTNVTHPAVAGLPTASNASHASNASRIVESP